MPIPSCSDKDFDAKVIKNPSYVLVDFWAPWCGPCKALGVKLENIQSKFLKTVEFVKINIDENTESASRYGVKSIPFLVLFYQGEVVSHLVGNVSEDELQSFLNSHLK